MQARHRAVSAAGTSARRVTRLTWRSACAQRAGSAQVQRLGRRQDAALRRVALLRAAPLGSRRPPARQDPGGEALPRGGRASRSSVRSTWLGFLGQARGGCASRQVPGVLQALLIGFVSVFVYVYLCRYRNMYFFIMQRFCCYGLLWSARGKDETESGEWSD